MHNKITLINLTNIYMQYSKYICNFQQVIIDFPYTLKK